MRFVGFTGSTGHFRVQDHLQGSGPRRVSKFPGVDPLS